MHKICGGARRRCQPSENFAVGFVPKNMVTLFLVASLFLLLFVSLWYLRNITLQFYNAVHIYCFHIYSFLKQPDFLLWSRIQDLHLWNLLEQTCLPAAPLHGSTLAPPARRLCFGLQNVCLASSCFRWWSLTAWVCFFVKGQAVLWLRLQPEALGMGKNNPTVDFPCVNKSGAGGTWRKHRAVMLWERSCSGGRHGRRMVGLWWQRYRGLLCFCCSCFCPRGEKVRETS